NLVGFHDLAIRVAEQRKWEPMFFYERLVAFCVVDTHAEQLGFRLNFAPGIAYSARLNSTTGRVVFRIEVKHKIRPRKIGKLNFLTTAIDTANRSGPEIRSGITNFKSSSHILVSKAVTADDPSQST